jgi:hypothetical protein
VRKQQSRWLGATGGAQRSYRPISSAVIST